MDASTRVVLTLAAVALFPDIGTRLGTEIRRSGAWAIVRWDGHDADTWLPAASVEPAP